MWYVENLNGDNTFVRRYFNSYQEAVDHAQWTLGRVGFDKEKEIV